MNIQLKDGLLIQKVVDEIVILEPETGDYYTLNEVGALMLGQMQKGETVANIVADICGKFDVSNHDVEQDLNHLMQELKQCGLAD